MNITNLLAHTATTQSLDAFAIDVLTGLSGHPKSMPAQYFYDDIGSELFQKISQHADYYPTKTEFAILAQAAALIPSLLPEQEIDIIELGAGDGHKSKLLIDGFLAQGRKVNFYPIDISEKAMQQLGDNFVESSQLSIHGIVADYFTGLHHLKRMSSHPKLVLFLGSNIGNFNRSQSQEFLKKVWLSLNAADHVLIGYDLKKATQLLNRAYNDSAGLTKAFNLNLLHRMNKELGANFDVNSFEHYGFYNPSSAAMESHLISLRTQEVYIAALEKHFHFAQFEPMHVESSYKFTLQDIGNLAGHNGYKIKHHFSDDNDYFMDALWQVQHKE
ncbi:MAG TPA: L-histidine N(alpha)-methyltransferase [Methylophilus sp.]